MKKYLLTTIMLLLCAVPTIAQNTFQCNLTTGCLYELTVTAPGTYDNYRVAINEVGQTPNPLTFALVVPKTSITPVELGVTQDISGVVIIFDGELKILDAATGAVLLQELKHVESGGTAIPHNFDVTVCATSPSEEDICYSTVRMTAT